MNKIFIHKTKIGSSCKIDAYLFQNAEKDVTLFGIDVPQEKEDLIDSFIELCNNDDNLHINIYNFVRNELLIIRGTGKESTLINKMNSLKNEIDNTINEKNNQLNFNIDLVEISRIFNVIGIQYYVNNGSLFKHNSTVKVPDVLCKYFSDAISNKNYDYLKSLDLFWTNCLLKKDTSNIEDLFLFIYENGLIITPKGYLFCFRRIRKKNGVNNEQLFRFVMNMWRDCLVNGDNPNNLYVGCDDGEYYTTTNNDNGFDTLQNIVQNYFNNSNSIPTYTDNRTKKFTYKVGSTYVVDNVDNDVNHTCSYGLHIGSKQYVYNNSWLGEQIVGCIVNPRDIIAVSDVYQKLRVRKMYIACLITESELNDFNPKVYHFDYEDDMIQDDNDEFATYIFNESYEKSSVLESKIQELKKELSDIENRLQSFANSSNVDVNKIIGKLTCNYVTPKDCKTD